ncbi:MAG TPA: tetratricopeptide repeat protein [Hellea balneolensis]|uniref:Tetratricopeptide repeat protein n=1 Tax=Hellea balneolensis TaxID=287478 RepID=A0A7C5R815_9PROT|nr:tetratricopeptide repeat protein [Hellea balneolensis]
MPVSKPDIPTPPTTTDEQNAPKKPKNPAPTPPAPLTPKPVPLKPKAKTITENDTILPFYVSARDYLDARGKDGGETLILKYKVKTLSADKKTESSEREIILSLGEDFAAFKSGVSTRIYDFRMRRFLTVSPRVANQDDGLYFDNVSLYAKAYRNISTVNKASNNGQRETVLLSAKSALDVFWIESAMGWAARDIADKIEFEMKDDTLLARYKTKPVAKIIAAKTPFITQGQKDAFFAFAHFEVLLHPVVLRQMYAFDAPPKTLEFQVFNPKHPAGQTQVWTLVDQNKNAGNFPLPANAKSTPERQPVSPLVFVINEAVHGRALGGRPSKAVLSQAFDKAFLSNAYYDAWLLAEKYYALYGACQMSTQAICKGRQIIASLMQTGLGESERASDQKLVAFLDILEKIKTPSTRVDGLKLFLPYTDDPNTPSFVLRQAAMARAKLKGPQISGLESLSAQAMLKQALIKDPYDPNSYVGLAQVLAANGAFEQSWDIYDALRAGIPGAQRVARRINRFEQKLQKIAPAFFAP